MRLLQVFEPPEGGVRRHVTDLTRGLIERGHQVDVALARDAGAARAFAALGARPFGLDLVPGIFDHRDNARALVQLTRLLRRERYELVHLHDSKAGAVGRPAAALARTPAVYTSHEMVYMSQHLRERRAAGARRALTLGVERALAGLAEVTICVTERERSVALADGAGRPDRLVTVHNGVRRPAEVHPDPELLAFRGEGPLVGYLGRLHQGKGLEDLVAALRRTADGAAPPRVAIVGNGPLREQLDADVAAAGLGERTRIVPFGGEPWPYVAAFDLLVVPSHFDALPLVILEAMAVGVPAVATRVGGIPEGIEDGVDGLLVPARDPERLAAAIHRLASDGGLRERLGAAARARYEARFTADRMVAETERVYAGVLAGR